MNYILYEYSDSTSDKKTALADFLHVAKGDIISFAGAGGKTTTIMTLAQELAGRNIKTLITTTTKMYWEDNAIESGDWNGLLHSLDKYRLAIFGTKVGMKMQPADEEFFCKASALADVMLIEADGARRLPFKMPRTKEPVYLKHSNKIVYLAGMSALNKPIKELFSPELLADFLGKKVDDKLTADDIINVLQSSKGAFKDTANRDLFIILNQADDEHAAEQAKSIARYLTPAHPAIKTAYSCHYQSIINRK